MTVYEFNSSGTLGDFFIVFYKLYPFVQNNPHATFLINRYSIHESHNKLIDTLFERLPNVTIRHKIQKTKDEVKKI